MLEGKPPGQADGRPLEPEQASAVLRELTWAELVARLAASRGMRRPIREDGDASFDAGSARRIAAHHQGKELVYPDDLSDGKIPEGTDVPASLGQLAPRGSE